MTPAAADRIRLDALRHALCARICDERYTEADLRMLESALFHVERRTGGDPLRVYVAAASAETARARAVVDKLRAAAGVVVTSTWLDVVAQVGDANPRDASIEARRGWVTQDLAEVKSSDVVLVLVPAAPIATIGAWCEAFHGRAHGVELMFAGDTKRSVFCAMGREFATDDEAIAAVVAMAVSCDDCAARGAGPVALVDDGEIVDDGKLCARCSAQYRDEPPAPPSPARLEWNGWDVGGES